MEFIIEKNPKKGLQAVLISDKGEKIEWSLSGQSRIIVEDVYDLVFLELNKYWATVSANRRKQIFALYADIREHINEVMEVQPLQKALTERITKLLEFHPEHELTAFLPQCNITYPTSVKEGGITRFQPDKTYDVVKYDRLLVLTLALRTLTPIWCVYVAAMDKYVGKNHKELMALKLLTKSWVAQCQAFSELQAYIRANTREDESSLSSVIGHVGSEGIPEWLLALACVRRLATKKMSGNGQDNNLVSQVHLILTQSLRSRDKSFSGFFQNKDIRPDGDENPSLLEEYKIKQVITEGERAMFSTSLMDLVRTTHKIDDTVDPKMVKASWSNNRKALDCTIGPGQTRILQWVCGPVLPTRSVVILNKSEKLKLLTVAQAVLWHWGYPHIAAFMVVHQVDDGMQKVQVAENRARFPKDLANRIAALYPHIPQHIKLTRHPVTEAVVKTVEDLSSSDWYIEAPADLIREVKDYIVDGQYVAPADIQKNLAELAIYIAERNQ